MSLAKEKRFGCGCEFCLESKEGIGYEPRGGLVQAV